MPAPDYMYRDLEVTRKKQEELKQTLDEVVKRVAVTLKREYGERLAVGELEEIKNLREGYDRDMSDIRTELESLRDREARLDKYIERKDDIDARERAPEESREEAVDEKLDQAIADLPRDREGVREKEQRTHEAAHNLEQQIKKSRSM